MCKFIFLYWCSVILLRLMIDTILLVEFLVNRFSHYPLYLVLVSSFFACALFYPFFYHCTTWGSCCYYYHLRSWILLFRFRACLKVLFTSYVNGVIAVACSMPLLNINVCVHMILESFSGLVWCYILCKFLQFGQVCINEVLCLGVFPLIFDWSSS